MAKNPQRARPFGNFDASGYHNAARLIAEAGRAKGQGMAAIGQGIGSGIAGMRADQREAARQRSADEKFRAQMELKWAALSQDQKESAARIALSQQRMAQARDASKLAILSDLQSQARQDLTDAAQNAMFSGGDPREAAAPLYENYKKITETRNALIGRAYPQIGQAIGQLPSETLDAILSIYTTTDMATAPPEAMEGDQSLQEREIEVERMRARAEALSATKGGRARAAYLRGQADIQDAQIAADRASLKVQRAASMRERIQKSLGVVAGGREYRDLGEGWANDIIQRTYEDTKGMDDPKAVQEMIDDAEKDIKARGKALKESRAAKEAKREEEVDELFKLQQQEQKAAIERSNKQQEKFAAADADAETLRRRFGLDDARYEDVKARLRRGGDVREIRYGLEEEYEESQRKARAMEKRERELSLFKAQARAKVQELINEPPGDENVFDRAEWRDRAVSEFNKWLSKQDHPLTKEEVEMVNQRLRAALAEKHGVKGE